MEIYTYYLQEVGIKIFDHYNHVQSADMNDLVFQSVTCSENYNSTFCMSRAKFLYIDFETVGGQAALDATFKLLVTARQVFKSKLSLR
jgi:hypothetical protein